MRVLIGEIKLKLLEQDSIEQRTRLRNLIFAVRMMSICFFEKHSPKCIVHCAAERHPDVCEADPEGSKELNVDVTKYLAEKAGDLGIFMLYISTDYVFDGENPPYYPYSKPNPLNFYGRTKLSGEEAVKRELYDYLILRVPILYGTEVFMTESSISSIAAALSEHGGGTFDDIAVRYPTHTGDVAGVIDSILICREKGKRLSGIYHFSGDESFTKYEMAQVMAGFLEIRQECLYPDREGSGKTDRTF